MKKLILLCAIPFGFAGAQTVQSASASAQSAPEVLPTVERHLQQQPKQKVGADAGSAKARVRSSAPLADVANRARLEETRSAPPPDVAARAKAPRAARRP
jgi:hypothetical protein